MMDPKLNYTSGYFDLRSCKNLSCLFYLKVVSAFKWKRFGQAWPGTFRLQVEALWLESSWKVFSMNGCVLLETVCKLVNYKIDSWYSLGKDLIVRHFGMEMDVWSLICKCVFIFQVENGSIDEDTRVFYYVWFLLDFLEKDQMVMFYKKQLNNEYDKGEEIFFSQDGNWKERKNCIKYFYSILRLQEGKRLIGVHVSSFRGGGGVLGRGEDPCFQEGRHLLIGYWVGTEHLKKGRLVLNEKELGVVMELDQVHVVPIDSGLVNEAGRGKLRKGKFQVGVGLGLLAPDRQFGLVVFQSGAEQVVVGGTRVVINKPGNGRKKLFLVFKKGRKCDTYFTTMGDFALLVCLEALAMNGGGILMLKWRADKSMTMFTSLSPGTLLGTAGPANTSDLEYRKNKMFLFGSSLFSPYNVYSFQSQEVGVRLLLVFGDSLGQGLHLVSQDLDLGLEVRHVGVVVGVTMDITSLMGKTIFQVLLGIEENILIASDLASQVWYEK